MATRSVSYVQVYKQRTLFLALSQDRNIKSITVLTVTSNVSSTHWVTKHAVNAIMMKQLISLGVDGIIAKRMLEKQLVVT